ncbi:hypothetical protein [Actinokineospora pegani]|uniref:hypothetical protein n=1 Tax=Actinokineospora pegani TaxID=2654637 RepID=UPI0012EAA1D7|nr:hypothetical protein [Actinokineospora pegani]
MARYAYVYVGSQAQTNFDIGLAKRTWGWKTDSHGEEVARTMAWLRRPHGLTWLVFAREFQTLTPPSGWPRTPSDNVAWVSAFLKSITLAQVTGPLREDHTPLWPDDTYPFRVPLGSLVELPAIPPGGLRTEVLATARDAMLRRGLPLLGPTPIAETDPVLDEIDDEPGEDVSDRLLDGLDGLDGVARTIVRKEQRRLRRKRFGDAESIPCSLCHRELPVGLLRLAHIKRRADATTEERLNLANTMAACTLGCDELFERGYLLVDVQGHLRRNPGMPKVTVDLDGALARLDGRTVLEHSPASAPFFAAHAARHSNAMR